jgi:CheY-like chemotaxis protein
MTDSIQILIVDDDITLRHMIVLQLASLGLKADSAANGVEALRRIHDWRYELILMDIQMPEMNGLDAAIAIRSYEASEGLEPSPIIAVTAGGASRKQCQDAGMSDYLQKPVSIGALQELVTKWLPG